VETVVHDGPEVGLHKPRLDQLWFRQRSPDLLRRKRDFPFDNDGARVGGRLAQRPILSGARQPISCNDGNLKSSQLDKARAEQHRARGDFQVLWPCRLMSIELVDRVINALRRLLYLSDIRAIGANPEPGSISSR
jgi:hypothetical protein